MDIYIEISILNNLMVDSLIFVAVVESCRLKVVWWRILLATILATIYAVALPYINFANNFALKLLLSLILVAIISTYATVGKYIFALMFFYLYTFLLGGVTYAVLYAFPLINTRYSYMSAVVCGGMLVVYMICKLVFNHIIYTRRQLNFEQKVIIVVGKKQVECNGYWDSGNTLFHKGIAVSIISQVIASKLGFDILVQNKNDSNMNSKQMQSPDLSNVCVAASLDGSYEYMQSNAMYEQEKEQINNNSYAKLAFELYKNLKSCGENSVQVNDNISSSDVNSQKDNSNSNLEQIKDCLALKYQSIQLNDIDKNINKLNNNSVINCKSNDSKNGKPIVTKTELDKTCNKKQSDSLFKKSNIKYKNIKVECVTGSQYLKLIRVDKIILLSKKVKTCANAYVAISNEDISYDIILNYEI